MDKITNSGEKSRILIVDDDRSNIMTLHHMLSPMYATLVARDGQTAIDIAKTVIPDLILLDVIMPDITGFEVLTVLKRDLNLVETPVIFITALDSAEDEEKGFAIGAADYITKPFSGPIVKARIKTHLKMAGYIRELKHFGVTDTLTGLPNRRSFNERVKIEWNRAIREKEPLSILMIDADDFKKYNDTHGHLQGDILLQSVAQGLSKSVVRAGDFVSRWGGEEFVVLLPNTDKAGAADIAERMRKNIKNTVIPLPDGSPTSITVSIGVNTEIPGSGRTIDEFLNIADQMVYAAKKAGKNRICA